MWNQWSAHGFQQHQAEPTEPEKSDQFLSFAKRSREVHRQYGSDVCVPSRVLQRPPLAQYDDAFWDNIIQHPSEEPPPFVCPANTFSLEPPELVCGYTQVRGTKRSSLCLENLPTPSQLMGRKKKKGCRQIGDTAERQVAAVNQHIRELRRKQSIIDQTKKEKWWGSTFDFVPETRCSPIAEELTETEEPNPTDSPLILQHAKPYYAPQNATYPNISSFQQEAFGDFSSVLDLAPGANPMMSFVVTGTADRAAQRDSNLDRLSCAEFWGFRSKNEE